MVSRPLVLLRPLVFSIAFVLRLVLQFNSGLSRVVTSGVDVVVVESRIFFTCSFVSPFACSERYIVA